MRTKVQIAGVDGLLQLVLIHDLAVTPDTLLGRAALRLLGPKGLFDAKLSARWSAAVYCTPEFSEWHQDRELRDARVGAPTIDLEVYR